MAIAFVLASAFSFSAAADTQPSEVKMPCADSASASGPTAGLRLCTQVLPDTLKLLEARIREQAEGKYQGCDLSNNAASVCANGKKGTPLPKPVCNIYPGLFNGNMAEIDSNHDGDSCGDWTYFRTHIKGRTCKMTPDRTGQNHRREEGYLRGAEIQSLNCYFAQVKNELSAYKLKLTQVDDGSGSKVDGPCAMLAKDFNTQSQAAQESSKSLQKQLGGLLNLSDIENCEGNDADPGRRRQSACQIVAARSSLEGVFNQLAACEVFYRAKLSYEKFRAITPTQKSVDDEVMSILNGRKGKSKQCKNSHIQSQYISYYLKNFRERADLIWNADTCK